MTDVSVLLATHSGRDREAYEWTIASVHGQEPDGFDYELLIEDDDDVGLAEARNNAVERAEGDILVFIDDDVVVTPGWLEQLVAPILDSEAQVVGGHVEPDRNDIKLPDELYWNIGCTWRYYNGVVENADNPRSELREIRNGIGCNIAFDRDWFEEFGGFPVEFGKDGDSLLQAEETVLCDRISQAGGKVVYAPKAVVRHRVDDEQLSLGYIVDRSWEQGRSKAMMEAQGGDLGEESRYAKRVVFESIPERLYQTGVLCVSVGATICGYAEQKVSEVMYRD